MPGDYLPPVVAEIILRVEDFTRNAERVRTTMATTADVVDTESTKASDATTRIGTSLQAASDIAVKANLRIATSAQEAGRMAAEAAAQIGESLTEQAAAAGRAAEEFVTAQSRMTAAQKAAGRAAAELAAAANLSADEQAAAYARAADAAEVEGEKISKTQKYIGESIYNSGMAMGGAFGGPLRGFGRQIEETQHVARSLVGTLGEVGKVVVYGGLIGFAAAAYEGVKAAMAFQTSLTTIAADSSKANAAHIGKAFLGTMGSTEFSATTLASSYAKVSEQLKVVEGHTLNTASALKVMASASELATATDTSLASSTSAVAQVMQAYHLRVGQAAKAADTLYSTSRATNSSIGEIATAMGRLHSRLGATTPSLKDVGGLMVAVAQTGMTGSRGIMQVSSALQTVTSNTTQVGNELQKLTHTQGLTGISGQFIGMTAMINRLHGAFSHLSPAMRLFASDTLFGRGAAQVMEQVIDKGSAAFQRDAQAADRAGAAHAAAAAQSRTLAVQLKTIRATVDDLAVSFGQMLIPVLQTVGHAIGNVAQWFDRNKAAAVALGSVIATVLGAAVGVFVFGKLRALSKGLGEIGADLSKLSERFMTWISSLSRTTPAVQGLGASADAAAPPIADLKVATTEAEMQLDGLDASAAAASAQLSLLGGDADASVAQLSLFNGEVGASVAQLDAMALSARDAAAAAAEMGAGGAMGAEGGVAAGAVAGGEDAAATGLGLGLAPETMGLSLMAIPMTMMLAPMLSSLFEGRKYTGLAARVPSPGSGRLSQGLGVGDVRGGRFGILNVPKMHEADVANNALRTLRNGLDGVTQTTQRSYAEWERYRALLATLNESPDITRSQRESLDKLTASINKAIDSYHRLHAVTGSFKTTGMMAQKEAGTVISRYQYAAQDTGTQPLEQLLGINNQAATERIRAATLAGRPTSGILASMVHGGPQAGYEREISQMHKQGLGKLVPELVGAHKTALASLTKQLVAVQSLHDAATLTMQATLLQGQTTAAQTANATEVAIIKDQQTIASDAMQAAATNISDSAAVMSAKMSAAATAISDASAVGQAKSSATVQALSDANAVQSGILGMRMLYGFELIAQRLQIQLDATKEGFNKQIAAQQVLLAEEKQHWDGRIAAASVNQARVQQHEDQMVAIAQQNEAIVQARADQLLGNAQEQADALNLKAAIIQASAQNAVTLSQNATPEQQEEAQDMLQRASAMSKELQGRASSSLEQVTASTQLATTNAAGAYKIAQDTAALAEARASKHLALIQGEANIAETKTQAAITRLTDTMDRVDQRLQDQINLAQAGGGRRVRSDATSLAHTGLGALGAHGGSGIVNDLGPAATGVGIAQETAYEKRMGTSGLHIHGGVHITGAGRDSHQIVHDLYHAVRGMTR